MRLWIAKYNLEILTFISVSFIVCVTVLMPGLSVIQKFIIVFLWLFTMHEWEEAKFPGGFLNLIGDNLLKIKVTDELAGLSRIPTMCLILGVSIIPFFFDTVWWLVMIPVTFGFMEGIVHIVAIKLFSLKKFYSPGMITALAELVLSAFCLWYLIAFCNVAWWEYLVGVVLFFACFACMQSRLTKLVDIPFHQFPKIMRGRVLSLIKNKNQA